MYLIRSHKFLKNPETRIKKPIPTKTEEFETLHNDIPLSVAISNYNSTGKGKKKLKKRKSSREIPS
jgi:hypothetical protein